MKARMPTIRLYACAILFAVWAVLWWAGVRSDQAVGAFLALIPVCVVLAQREASRRRREMRR